MSFDDRSLRRVLQTPLKLNAKSGERVLIITDTDMDPRVWSALQGAAVDLGMEPIVSVITPREAHSTNPPDIVCDAALDSRTDISVYLTSTAMAHATLTDSLIEQRKRFILMEELSVEMLGEDGPGSADYPALNRLGLKLADVYTRGNSITVTCPNGTHLTASIVGRPGRSIAGLPLEMRPNGGIGCAFPDGESHVCPVEGTGQGRIVFDLTAHSTGLLDEPIVIEVESGRAVSIEGGRGAEIWRSLFERFHDEHNYNCPAEIAIGLNPKVTPTGKMRTDKKMYGAVHIGLGDTIALGGTCHARLRLEGVISKPEVTVDGQILTKDGKILLDTEGVSTAIPVAV